MKCYVCILFGLFVIWTGLLRSIEAQEFKPNAFWFCLTMGITAIAAGFLLRVGNFQIGAPVAAFAGIVVLAFYVYCLVKQPEQDATYRVGLAIVAAIAELTFILLPNRRGTGPEPE